MRNANNKGHASGNIWNLNEKELKKKWPKTVSNWFWISYRTYFSFLSSDLFKPSCLLTTAFAKALSLKEISVAIVNQSIKASRQLKCRLASLLPSFPTRGLFYLVLHAVTPLVNNLHHNACLTVNISQGKPCLTISCNMQCLAETLASNSYFMKVDSQLYCRTLIA